MKNRPFHRQDGCGYYEDLENKLEADFATAREEALRSPLGMTFVTFGSINMAKTVYDSFRYEADFFFWLVLSHQPFQIFLF